MAITETGLPASSELRMQERAEVSIKDVRAAAARLAPRIHRTPCWESRTFSAMCGQSVWLKYENLQRTGSYKIRGALNRILTLPDEQRECGVIAASAGNHAQGVAVAAQLAGVKATIVMPLQAPLTKVAATRSYGARVVLHGEAFDEAHSHAMRMAADEGLTYVHPFDDPAVMAGQGTVALEMFEDAPAIDTLLVPIGGGGLIAGSSVVAHAVKPGCRVIGVQAAGANSTYLAYHDRYTGPLKTIHTIADGLATRAPGNLTLPIIRRNVDDVVTVSEDAIAEAVVLLMERAKTVVEPAGAVALAALLSHQVPDPGKNVGAMLSGGNVDLNLIDRIIQYGLGAGGRHLHVRTQLIDRPGALVHLSVLLNEHGANIFQVVHHRIGAALSVNEVDLDLTLEVRDHEHGQEVLQALRDAGYHTQVHTPRPD